MTSTASAKLRYSILVAVSCMYLGIYWIYDLPSALSTQLQDYLSLTDSQYAYLLSSLYIAFAVPSVVLPFFSGFVIQKYGARLLLLCCLTAVISSQLGFCIAMQVKSIAGLVIARVLLGMGGETLGVLGTEVVTRWFPGDKTGLAMAIYSSISSLGTVANSNITPRLTVAYSPLTATWLSSILAVGLLVLSTLYVLTVDVTETYKEEKGKNEDFMRSLRRLPRSYWYIASICLTGYGCLLPFFNSAQRFIASRFYENDQTVAGLAVGMVHFVGGVLPVLLGLLLEIPALRNYSLALLYSQIMMLVPHVLFLVDFGGSVLPLSILAIGNALFSTAIWASVSVSILQHQNLMMEPPTLEMDHLPAENRETSPEAEVGEADSASSLISNIEQRSLDAEGLLSGTSSSPIVEDEVHGNSLVMIGYGIVTSLMGMSVVIFPFFLSAAENWAEFPGLEMVFVAIAGVGVFISLGLVIKEKKLQ